TCGAHGSTTCASSSARRRACARRCATSRAWWPPPTRAPPPRRSSIPRSKSRSRWRKTQPRRAPRRPRTSESARAERILVVRDAPAEPRLPRARDHVEARAPRVRTVLAQPGGRTAREARLLARVDRRRGAAEGVARARLHLDEDNEIAAHGDEI